MPHFIAFEMLGLDSPLDDFDFASVSCFLGSLGHLAFRSTLGRLAWESTGAMTARTTVAVSMPARSVTMTARTTVTMPMPARSMSTWPVAAGAVTTKTFALGRLTREPTLGNFGCGFDDCFLAAFDYLFHLVLTLLHKTLDRVENAIRHDDRLSFSEINPTVELYTMKLKFI